MHQNPGGTSLRPFSVCFFFLSFFFFFFSGCLWGRSVCMCVCVCVRARLCPRSFLDSRSGAGIAAPAAARAWVGVNPSPPLPRQATSLRGRSAAQAAAGAGRAGRAAHWSARLRREGTPRRRGSSASSPSAAAARCRARRGDPELSPRGCAPPEPGVGFRGPLQPRERDAEKPGSLGPEHPRGK